MQIERISASAATTYNGCQMQYYMDYILKWRFPAGKAANIGTVTHKILEILGKIRVAQLAGDHFKNDTFDLLISRDEDVQPDYIVDKIAKIYSSSPAVYSASVVTCHFLSKDPRVSQTLGS